MFVVHQPRGTTIADCERKFRRLKNFYLSDRTSHPEGFRVDSGFAEAPFGRRLAYGNKKAGTKPALF
jgi:hypothetical protein